MRGIANVHVEYYMASVRVSLRVQRPAPLAIVVSIIPTNYQRWLMAPGADNQWPYMQTASHAPSHSTSAGETCNGQIKID